MTSVRIFRNGVTVAIRSVSRARRSASLAGIRRRHHVRDRVDGLAQLAARHDRLDRLPQIFQGQYLADLGYLQQHLHRGGQPRRVPGKARMPSCPILVDGGLGLADQLGNHEQVQQFQAVVHRPGFQVGDGRQQRGQLPLVAVSAQRLRAGRHPVPGQFDYPAVRDVRVQVQAADPEAADLAGPVQPLSRFRPLGLDGPLRHRSRSEYLVPSGTTTSLSRLAA